MAVSHGQSEAAKVTYETGREKRAAFCRDKGLYLEWFVQLAALKNLKLVCYYPKEQQGNCRSEYSMMTHSKVNFVRRMVQQFPGHSHYSWIDFGIVRVPLNPDTMFDWRRLMDKKIHMQVFAPSEQFPSDPRELCLKFPDAMSASVFIVLQPLAVADRNTRRFSGKLILFFDNFI